MRIILILRKKNMKDLAYDIGDHTDLILCLVFKHLTHSRYFISNS